MPIMSQLAQLSTILPSTIRSMVIPVQLSSLLVGWMPINGPLCVPIDVNRVLLVNVLFHITVDANGRITASIEEVEIQCR
jgi:hypothetical protein